MLHPALSRALATAHIEDLHRAAAQRHTIPLAHSVTHEPHMAAPSRVPILSGRRWTGRRDRRARRDRLPMQGPKLALPRPGRSGDAVLVGKERYPGALVAADEHATCDRC